MVCTAVQNVTQDRTLDKGTKDKFNNKPNIWHKFEGLTNRAKNFLNSARVWDFIRRWRSNVVPMLRDKLSPISTDGFRHVGIELPLDAT